MDAFEERLNEILVDTFWSILKVQEQFIQRLGNISHLSMSEMHLIEVVGDRQTQPGSEGCTVTAIAETLAITLPSVTAALKKLIQKGCVVKSRSDGDGRMVFIRLTALGQEIYNRHNNFHKKMVDAVSVELSEEEKSILLKGISSLNDFFKQKIAHETI